MIGTEELRLTDMNVLYYTLTLGRVLPSGLASTITEEFNLLFLFA